MAKRKSVEAETPTLSNTDKFSKLKFISDNAPKQRTAGWFEMRKKRITASDVGSCLRKNYIVCKTYIEEFGLRDTFVRSDSQYCNPYSNRNDFILKKNGFSTFVDNEFVRWGNKYEDAAMYFYESIKQTKVYPFGLIPHQTLDWLACSPDGITRDGVMLEIKCPFKRKLNGIPPIYYWQQCQLQLEVCDLDVCDYIECNIDIITEKDFLGDIFNKVVLVLKSGERVEQDMEFSKGVMLSYDGDEDEKTGKKKTMYLYPPRKYITNKEKLEWANNKCMKYKNFNMKKEFYSVNVYTLNRLKRDVPWFNTIKPMLLNTWKKVQNFNYEDYKEYYENKGENEITYTENINSNICLV
jgi:putative phage-type endonuclease